MKRKILIVPAAVAALSVAAVVVRGHAAPPDAGIIQSAYEQELQRGSAKHDRGLRVRAAECNPSAASPSSFICSIQFTSEKDRDDRLYLDIVQLDRNDRGWLLKSGLCRS